MEHRSWQKTAFEVAERCNSKKLKSLDLPRAKANNVLAALKRKNVKLFKI